MANEIHHDHTTGSTLYFCAFQPDGNVFLTGGASDEVWGTGGRDADDYDEAMTEDGVGGHYVGTFDTSIAAGQYQVAVYLQVGANPADTDTALARGEIYWDGTAEISPFTIDTSTLITIIDHLTDIKGTGFVKDTDSLVDLGHTGDDNDTLETLSDQLDGLTASVFKNTVIYAPGE